LLKFVKSMSGLHSTGIDEFCDCSGFEGSSTCKMHLCRRQVCSDGLKCCQNPAWVIQPLCSAAECRGTGWADNGTYCAADVCCTSVSVSMSAIVSSTRAWHWRLVASWARTCICTRYILSRAAATPLHLPNASVLRWNYPQVC